MTAFDAGKEVKGRKRHIVDTLGLLLAFTLRGSAGSIAMPAADVVALPVAKVPGLDELCTDAAYGGQCAGVIETAHLNMSVGGIRRPGDRSAGTWCDAQQSLWPDVVPSSFLVQANRWVVERSRAWSERAPRLMARQELSSWPPVVWVWRVEVRILAPGLAG